jgi:Tfp pilus assembly protein PilX
MALLIALSAIVLLTILVLAFFSNSLLNRKISFSDTNMVKADQLARSALEIVKGEVREEIADPSYSSSNTGGNSAYPTFYQPLAPVDAIPQKVGITGSTGSGLVKVSANTSAIDPGANGRTMGSSISIATASLNGRYLSSDRWFGSGGPQLGTNGALPTWVYVTRAGVQTPVLSSVADPTNTGYVIGRFAYTVYDQGGLMDANVAGYPSVAATAAPFKSSLAFADLGTALGITGLTAWRNASTGADATGNTFTEWASGFAPAGVSVAPAAMAAQASGHLASVAGDNVFFSRQDLLLAAQDAGDTGLTSADLGYLTHFSRTFNAPSWAPPAATPSLNTSVNPDLAGDVRFPAAATITHYDDQGQTSSYAVLAGDPLIQHRFSLAKLAWITSEGPSADLSGSDPLYNKGGTDAAVQACFGLKWNPAVVIGGVASPAWEYVGTPGSSAVQPSIETLAQVAAEATSREPNFFELLKAGILTGSTGLATVNTTNSDPSSQKVLDGAGDLQILRIGANIIDQASTDNFPSTIVLQEAGLNVPVYGVKDLPYLYGALTGFFSQCSSKTNYQATNKYSSSGAPLAAPTMVTTTQYQPTNLALVVVPELFNPHAATSFASGPTKIQIVLSGGTINTILVSGEWQAGQPLFRSGAPLPSPTPTPIEAAYNPGSSDPYRTAVTPVTLGATGDASAFSTLLPWINDTTHGFVLYNYSLTTSDAFTFPSSTQASAGNIGYPNAISNPAWTLSGVIRAFLSSDLQVKLQYWNPQSAQWITYDTLCGNEAFGTSSGLGDASSGQTYLSSPSTGTQYLQFIGPGIGGSGAPLPYTNQLSLTGVQMSLYGKLDPRTSRWGPSANEKYFTSVSAPVPSGSFAYYGLRFDLPFGSGTENSGAPDNGTWAALWAQGEMTGWSDVSTVNNVADLFANLNQTTNTSTAPTARPVILGRPFRSVAELGYVFRDSPWKSLSFFDSSSGDGALLDLFSVTDEPSVVAGRIALNSPQSNMPQALLSGVAQSSDGTTSVLSSSSASAIAAAYQSYAYSSGAPTATFPTNRALLPTFMSSSSLTGAYPLSTAPVKNYRESVVRAFTAGTQTRTWNLLIDVVAQVGRFPSGGPAPTSLANFVVEGEKRYWLSVAIDRYTNKVIDEQWEPVND